MTINELKQLSEGEINIKVANLIGIQTRYFRYSRPGHDFSRYWVDRIKTREEAEDRRSKEKWGDISEVEEYTDLHRVPLYATDLNAMHEVEMTLPDHDGPGSRWDYFMTFLSIYDHALFATARQRAEAFILTMEGGKE